MAARRARHERSELKFSFAVDQPPTDVFYAVNNVRGWWSEEIDGSADKLGAEFNFHYKDFHRSTQEITELVPGKKVVWHVSDAQLNFVERMRQRAEAPRSH